MQALWFDAHVSCLHFGQHRHRPVAHRYCHPVSLSWRGLPWSYALSLPLTCCRSALGDAEEEPKLGVEGLKELKKKHKEAKKLKKKSKHEKKLMRNGSGSNSGSLLFPNSVKDPPLDEKRRSLEMGKEKGVKGALSHLSPLILTSPANNRSSGNQDAQHQPQATAVAAPGALAGPSGKLTDILKVRFVNADVLFAHVAMQQTRVTHLLIFRACVVLF